ncbi:MAG: hypothetical protein ACQGVK_20110 [Myxococcota bacterium]
MNPALSRPLGLAALLVAFVLAAPASLGHAHGPITGPDTPRLESAADSPAPCAGASRDSGSCAFCRVGAKVFTQPFAPAGGGPTAGGRRLAVRSRSELRSAPVPGLCPARAPPTSRDFL